MGSVFRILARDFKRLFAAPAALIVAIALIVLPSLYTWYNVLAFWDPYNSTGNLSVCVVNQDAGTSTEMTGELDIGDMMIEQLQENDQLNWITDKDYDTAMEELRVGKVYAVYVLPEDFSACLVSPLTGDITRPHIEYYANEKLGPVSPKITDAAANALEQKINSAFVTTVAEVATQAIDDAAKTTEAKISSAKSETAERTEEAMAAVSEVRDTLASISSTIDESRTKLATANNAMSGVSTLANDMRAVLQDVTDEADAMQSSLASISSGSISKLSNMNVELAQVTADANALVDAISGSVGDAQAKVDMAAAKIQPVINVMRETAADLEAAAQKLPDRAPWDKLKQRLMDAAADINARADRAQAILDSIVQLASEAGNVAQAASEAAQTVNDVSTQASSSLEQYSSELHTSAESSVNSIVSEIDGVCAQLSAAVTSLEATVGQASPLLQQLDSILANSKTALSQTDGLIGSMQADVESVVADARLLAQSDVISNLLNNGTLNAENISEFMGSPTELSTTKLYHPNAYGTAMSPLFMNLSFWIGAFMLVIVFLLEVDSEGLGELKPWQRYLGRFLMFCIFAVLQAIVCCTGTLALGVQAANIPAFYVGAIVSSLAFLSVIYALSATFKHVGKALCIVLVFAQIPGGSGLYPIEMTSSFFQGIYPFLPFSYGIDAMREAICGFYSNYFAHDLIILGVFFFGAMTLGLILVPLMSNVVRMTVQQIQEGDLYNSEKVMTPERPYRSVQMLRALAEKDTYRAELTERYARFTRRYPIFIRSAIVLGIVVPSVVAVLFALDAVEKVQLLTFTLIWLILLIAFLVTVESLRFSFKRQLNLENMSEARLLRVFNMRNQVSMMGFRRRERDNATDEQGDSADGEEDASSDGEASGFKSLQVGSQAPAGGINNVFLIARRDFSGLFKNVMSTIITLGLVVLPSLFAMYNILACWNVFDNTKNLSVAVASEDAGFTSDLMPLNVNIGDKVVSALRENNQINWVFTDAEDAVDGVKAGRYYASLVIPSGFSRDMLTFYEGDSASATIDYYVNEKRNAIAPNITGMGADMVSYQVNSTFVNTLSEVAIGVAQSLSKIAEDDHADARIAVLAEHMRSVADRLDQSADVLGLYSSLSRDTQSLVRNGAATVTFAHDHLQATSADIDTEKERLRTLGENLAGSVTNLSGSLGNAETMVANLEQRANALSDSVSVMVSDVATRLRTVASDIDAKVAVLNDIIAKLEKLRDDLKSGTSAQIDSEIDNGKANVKIDIGDGTVYESEKDLREDIQELENSIDSLIEAKEALIKAEIDAKTEDKPRLQEKIENIEATITKLTETRDKLQQYLDSKVDVTIDYDVSMSTEVGVVIENTIIIDADIAALQKAVQVLQQTSTKLKEAADSLEAGQADVRSKAEALRNLVAQVKADVVTVKEDLANNLQPGADQLKADIATLIADLETGANELRALDPDLAGTLESVATSLEDATNKMDDANAKLRNASGRVRDLANAVDAASQSGDIDKLRSLLQDNASDLAAALTAPVQVERTALFPSENFGSSMTPLYCTLGLFIGALLIMVAMKPEVSRKGREELTNPKPRHLYFGRFCAVGLVSLMQTTLMGLCCIFFLKVQMTHPILFMIGFWLSGLILSFIVYTLVVSFGNLGKAIAVILLIIQVTACGGSYPLQVLPDFVQMFSPWVPATYIVHALQAAMMGVYNNDFWISMGHLALFIIPFLLLGLVLRKPMERFMKFYVSKVEECKIME